MPTINCPNCQSEFALEEAMKASAAQAGRERYIVMTWRWFAGFVVTIMLFIAMYAGAVGWALGAGYTREVVLLFAGLFVVMVVLCLASRLVFPGYRWWRRLQRRMRGTRVS